jgi:hypothetical protein
MCFLPLAQALAQLPYSLLRLRGDARHAALTFRQKSLDMITQFPQPATTTPANLKVTRQPMPHVSGEFAIQVTKQLNLLDVLKVLEITIWACSP